MLSVSNDIDTAAPLGSFDGCVSVTDLDIGAPLQSLVNWNGALNASFEGEHHCELPLRGGDPRLIFWIREDHHLDENRWDLRKDRTGKGALLATNKSLGVGFQAVVLMLPFQRGGDSRVKAFCHRRFWPASLSSGR